MNVYNKDLDDMIWSYSRLTTYHNCPYEFYLNYILKDNENYLCEGNYYAEVGSFVHSILERILNKEITVEEAHQYYKDEFETNVCYQVDEKIMNKTYEACADYFENLNFDWLKDYEILGVELQTDFYIKGYKFIGFIDLLLRDKADKKIILLDHKSAQYPLKLDGKPLKTQEKSFDKYKKQMYLYSYFIKEKYGEFPKELWWNHFKVNKIAKIKFDEKEYQQSINWVLKTLKSIYSDDNYKADKNYFYCHNLCNFRNSCEYAKDR